MATSKSFLTFTQQVTSLNEKNIIISDSQYAEEMLHRIGYFSLMGYKHLFRIPLTKVNVLTFGSISKMYEILQQSLRAKVCKHFPSVNQKQLGRYLSVLTKYRNACAHGARLFTYKTVDQILDTPFHAKLTIPKKRNQYVYGKQDLFSVVIAFRYLLPNKEFKAFKKRGHTLFFNSRNYDFQFLDIT